MLRQLAQAAHSLRPHAGAVVAQVRLEHLKKTQAQIGRQAARRVDSAKSPMARVAVSRSSKSAEWAASKASGPAFTTSGALILPNA